jgi:hypothetical protein
LSHRIVLSIEIAILEKALERRREGLEPRLSMRHGWLSLHDDGLRMACC